MSPPVPPLESHKNITLVRWLGTLLVQSRVVRHIHMLCLKMRLHIRIVHGVRVLAQRAGQDVLLLGLDLVPLLAAGIAILGSPSSSSREASSSTTFHSGSLASHADSGASFRNGSSATEAPCSTSRTACLSRDQRGSSGPWAWWRPQLWRQCASCGELRRDRW